MADKSLIEWCDATINVVYGCTPQSPGCDHCYAACLSPRLGVLTDGTHKNGRWTGKLNIFPERMLQACRWRKPRRIFVNSMGDLFHRDVPDETLDTVFAVMALCPQHVFLVLTKRPEKMRGYLTDTSTARADGRGEALSLINPHEPLECIPWPLPNVWLGVTAENQAMADYRIPILLDTPAAKRFVSIEPMLGPIRLDYIRQPSADLNALKGHWEQVDHWNPNYTGVNLESKLSWVICGGESGPGARPMHPDWVSGLRDQCVESGVPFFFKQWGEFHEADDNITAWHGRIDGVFVGDSFLSGYGNIRPDIPSSGVNMCRVGKKRAGRTLDGRTWEQFPEVRP